jgi:RNA polymerase sigma-70 factor (ECF subfamily)
MASASRPIPDPFTVSDGEGDGQAFATSDSVTDSISSDPSADPSTRQRIRRQHEHALIARMRGGDETAFEELYRSYYRPLLQFVSPLVSSLAIAEEVVEDVFIQLWENRESIRIQHSVNTYLFTAVRNRAFNVARREQVERRWHESAAVAPSDLNRNPSGLQADDERIDSERIQSVVRAAIEALPEQRRRVLQLRWQQGMSYAEIAEVVGSSVVAVERQLSRTLKALRMALPEWLSSEDYHSP